MEEEEEEEGRWGRGWKDRARRRGFCCAGRERWTLLLILLFLFSRWSDWLLVVWCRSVSSVATQKDGFGGDEDAVQLASSRVSKLEVALKIRKLYRNLLRADGLLGLPSPIYTPDETMQEDAIGQTAAAASDASDAAAAAQKRVDEAVDYVAELELIAEELRVRWEWLV